MICKDDPVERSYFAGSRENTSLAHDRVCVNEEDRTVQ